MPRDALLLEEMIEAADQAVALVRGVTAAELAADRMRRDVTGEGSSIDSEN